MTNDDDSNRIKRELGLLRLKDPFYLGLTAAKMGDWREYGDVLENAYKQTLASQAPSGTAYNELFRERLLTGEAVTDQTLQNDAFGLINASLGDVTVNDILKLVGAEKVVSDEYRAKYVHEIPEDEAKTLKAGFLKMTTDSVAAQVLGARQVQTRSGLEEIFCGNKSRPRNGQRRPGRK